MIPFVLKGLLLLFAFNLVYRLLMLFFAVSDDIIDWVRKKLKR